jgi:leucyl aminopeptidase
MTDRIRATRDAGALPLYLVNEQDAPGWLAATDSMTANWLRAQGFRGEALKLMAWPDARGNLAGAVFGLGRGAAPGFWQAAALAERLPPGAWYVASSLSGRELQTLVEGFGVGCYRFDRYRKLEPRVPPATLACPTGVDLARALRAVAADAWARDLINTPASDLGPEQLSQSATDLAVRHHARSEIIVGDALLERRLPLVHAVGRTATEAPRLIDLRWGDPRHPSVTLVGKGVCFDTGGLDLKPSAGMALMKKDMGGAAVALGVAARLMEAGLPVNLRVLVPAVENAIGGGAMRPGDVIRSRKGLTVEINNTDAEGRLVLADALALADEDAPELLVDCATLTGAARVALGPELPALFANDDTCAEALLRAGDTAGDPLWRLPLWSGYDEELGSKFADLQNVAASGFAGAIFGALFLQRFVARERRWLHIDLYAWNGRERPGRPVGAEAQALRALADWLESRYGGAPA